MLTGENRHGVVEGVNIVEGSFLCTFTLVMYDFGFRKVVVPVSSQGYAIGKVYILAVHEEVLVQKAYFIQAFLSHHHVSPRKNIHDMRFLVGKMPHVILCEPLGMRKERGKPAHLAKTCPRSGKAPFAFLQYLAMSVNHLYAQASAIGVSVHEIDTFGKRILLHDSVRI